MLQQVIEVNVLRHFDTLQCSFVPSDIWSICTRRDAKNKAINSKLVLHVRYNFIFVAWFLLWADVLGFLLWNRVEQAYVEMRYAISQWPTTLMSLTRGRCPLWAFLVAIACRLIDVYRFASANAALYVEQFGKILLRPYAAHGASRNLQPY